MFTPFSSSQAILQISLKAKGFIILTIYIFIPFIPLQFCMLLLRAYESIIMTEGKTLFNRFGNFYKYHMLTYLARPYTLLLLIINIICDGFYHFLHVLLVKHIVQSL